MFLTIKDSEGNPPETRAHSTYEDAMNYFVTTSLDKYAPNVHLVEVNTENMGTTVLKSRFRVDGEDTTWLNPLA